MALTVNYLAQTLWNHPIYGVIIAPFIACSCNAKEMVEALEVYEGTIVWKVTKPCKNVPQGYYTRVAPRPEWLRAYVPDNCEIAGERYHGKWCTKCSGH